MPKTREFKSGKSQAVRIPADLAYAMAILRDLPKPPEVERRIPIELPERD